MFTAESCKTVTFFRNPFYKFTSGTENAVHEFWTRKDIDNVTYQFYKDNWYQT
jgi:hypothetical protein